MTYFEFHLTFILPAIALAALVQTRPIGGLGVRALGWMLAVGAIAFVYTIAWDNYLVYKGVWTYPPGRVLATIGYVPVEEYAFFVLQPILTGLVYLALRGRHLAAPRGGAAPGWFRPVWIGTWLALALVGVALIVSPDNHHLYLGLILAWAAPVPAGMAVIASNKIWQERRRIAVATAIPTVYLWIADRYAIADGIWDIVDRYSLGFDPFGLPIEEAMFFLVTNVMCTCGLALFLPAPSGPAAEPLSPSVRSAAPHAHA